MMIIVWIALGILAGNTVFFGILIAIHAIEQRRERKEAAGWQTKK